ncbi:sensor histidine kinase [Actinomadura roseirufa]|uniref:sensor histidine kinase n=1 Tax=Actinomadura roseirufa TaxID=2094049 RepID=UPI001A954477|nr:histidine kinase [Actinomadura roseirufa]
MNVLKGPASKRVPDLDLERMDGQGPGERPFLFWLVLLIWPILDLVHGGTRPLWLGVIAVLAFAVVYVAVIRTAFDGSVPLRVPAGLLIVGAGAASAACLGFGSPWYALFPLLGIATGVVAGHAPRNGKGPDLPILVGIGGVSLLCALVIWGGGNGAGVLPAWYGTVTAGMVTAVILRLVAVIGLLRAAREELAEAAVARERLRFSRDLHDLLGHTLSLMVVKAQAVRRLTERDPALAAAQAADIEAVGRQALGEVREAVSGYRGRGLSDELDAARTALADADVVAAVRRAGPALPPEAEALLGWAVREGVTNVIRHSGARHCEITVLNDGDRAVLEIRDDGGGLAPGSPLPDDPGGNGSHALSAGSGGHGLRGLTERMGAVAGTVEAGTAPGGGFLLTVIVPVLRAP